MACQGKEQPKLKIPYCPSNDDKGHYEVNTLEEKTVSEYTGYSFNEVEDLTVLEYWLLLRDAVVYNCSLTEEGRKYLDDCWRMEQTEPDRQGLREHFKKN